MGRFRPGAAGLTGISAGPTNWNNLACNRSDRTPVCARRRCSRFASRFQFLLLQDPSARHLRDTCWPCSRLAVNNLLLQGKQAVLSRPCIQAVFCTLSRSCQQSEPATPSRLSDTNNPRTQRRPVDSRRPALQDAASRSRFADVMPLRSLSPIRWISLWRAFRVGARV